MTYDITLYKRSFLTSALERRLGDWTGAPELPPDVRSAVTTEAVRVGFRLVPQDPRFVAFAAAQGHTVADEYVLDTADNLATLTVFPNSMAFAIPSSPRATSSITRCVQLAHGFASSFQLGCYDPQTGEAIA
jgi:hypothetical protein